MPASPPPITDRDRELLRFAAEHRFVLAAQIARLLGVTPYVARRRLGELRGAGLLESRRPLRHETSAYAVTRAGLALVGSDLTPPRAIDLATYRHDVGVTWLTAGAHRGIFGELSAVVGERRMRSEDRRAERPDDAPRHGVRLPNGQMHYPDLVVVTASGRRVAFELELKTKQPARLGRILSAYASDRRIDAVVYLVPTEAGARAVRRAAARTGARDVVRVQRFSWAGGRAPGEPPREATRASTRATSQAATRAANGAGARSSVTTERER